MLDIKTFILGQLQTNTYLINSKGNNCYLIDPADDFVFLSDYINQHNLNPKGIILTHGHFDHCLAVPALKMIFDIPLIASHQDIFLLKQISKSAKYWTNQDYRTISISKVDFDLDKIKSLDLDSHSFQVIKTPGHTPGSICLYSEQNQLIFTGDTLFKSAVGRTDLSYSDPDKLKISLKQILMLPPNSHIFPGHGDTSTIFAEQKSLANFF